MNTELESKVNNFIERVKIEKELQRLTTLSDEMYKKYWTKASEYSGDENNLADVQKSGAGYYEVKRLIAEEEQKLDLLR